MHIFLYQRKRRPNAHFSVEFIFDDVRRRLETEERIETVIAPAFSNGLFRRLWIAADAWRRRADVVHVTGDINFAAIPLSTKNSVLTVLDCGFLHRTRGWRHQLLKLFWLTWPVSRARIVTTISQSVRHEILGYCKCDPNKVRIVPVAISPNFQYSQKVFDRSCPRILQMGTAPNKNIPRLIEALAGIPCTLVIVGRLGADVLNLAQRLGVRIENHVNLPHEAVLDQYRRCDIVAFPSTYEGFGMPILEGNATGRPVLTSNCSSMPEVAGDAAYLVDPLDVISIRLGVRQLIDDTDLRSSLIERGLVNVTRFRGELVAEMYREIYREIVYGTLSSKCWQT